MAIQTTDVRYVFEGQNRRVLTHATTTPNRPLLVALHSAYTQVDKFSALIDAAGLAAREDINILLPQGLPDLSPRWDDSPIYPRNLNDVGFLNAIITNKIAALSVNPEKIYGCGYSNGSFMWHRYLHDPAATINIKALFLNAGALLNQYTQPGWATSGPTSIIMFNGTSDTQVAYNGSIGVLSAPETAKYYVDEFIGPGAIVTSGRIRNKSILDGTRTTWKTWTGDKGTNVQISLYTINNGGHTWPGSTKNAFGLGKTSMDFDATQVGWDFVEQF